MKIRDANHYRRMFNEGDPSVGNSLAARAFITAHPDVDYRAAYHYFDNRFHEATPARVILNLMDRPASGLPEGLRGDAAARRPGRPSEINDAVEIRATLARTDVTRAAEIGGGNVSLGVRTAIRAYPISGHTTENRTPARHSPKKRSTPSE